LIYSKLHAYEEAVELSLKFDIELAKINAEKPEDEDQRKNLWLCIAKNVIEEKKDIKMAMNILQESKDLLKIEDILPFFPDYVQIKTFKEEIIQSLKEYNNSIDLLKKEMEVSDENSKRIMGDIDQLKEKTRYIDTKQQICEICHFSILDKSFFLFPCQHVYHTTCLAEEMIFYIPHSKVEETKIFIKAMIDLDNKYSPANTFYQEKMIKIHEELGNIVAKECLYCGDLMIESITQPFQTIDF